MKLCRNTLLRFLVALVIISSLVTPPAFCQESEDSQVFISGFNAYQQKDYASAIEKMNEVLQKYPDSPLRDMALFWLARSYFKAGNLQEAARNLSRFSKEYPDNPLKGTVEEELLALTARYDKGEKLPVGSPPAKQPDRLAAQKEKAEKERLAAEKAEEAKRTAAVAEAASVAALEQAAEKALAEKKELERIAALKLDAERLEKERAAEQKLAAEKSEQQRLESEKGEQQRIALLKAEEDRKAAVQAEQLRLEREKAEQMRIAALKQDQERIAATKAENERLVREKSEREKIAAEQAEQQRLAALKLENDRLAAEKAEQERVASVAAEQTRLAAVKAEEERKAAVNQAEQERLALLKAEDAKQAAVAAETARAAALKAEAERKSAEKAALDTETARLAAARAEELRLAQQRVAEETIKRSKTVFREKAIEQYKSIIESYPGTPAATTAAAKLRELGVAVALPPKVAEVEVLPENAQVLRLEVAQFAGFEFNLLARPEAFNVARQIGVPFEIINRGNGSDSFSLESAFPADFRASFAGAASPSLAINQTPDLAPGEAFKGIINLIIPAASIDGLRITHPVKATSHLMAEASQTREIRLIASAPLLRAVLKSDKTQPLPGEKIVYRIALLNVGSTVAEDVTFRLNFPPQLEPVDYSAAGFKQETKSALVLEGLQIKSGESRELSVVFQLKEDSLAGQELAVRAELANNQLKTSAAFISNLAFVQSQRGILVRTGPERLLVVPGQTISVPFIITNTGNVREKFKIVSNVKGAQDVIVFHDINRDGIRQASEPEVSEIGPLAPKEEASIVIEVKTPKTAIDSSEGNVLLTFSSEGEPTRSASGSARFLYSRPVLQLAMAGRNGRLKPGEVASFDLTISNKGSNLAKIVELQSTWPEQLELVAADPANSTFTNGNVTWRFKELGANEKRIIKVSFRVKPGTGVGTNIQVKNILTYEDQIGNRY
ncbi:MAG: tetratricopeptide repeat protein [Steroidobacteraceae bacterium]|nr:tetratricopeptide repeat protein [Deltaproteobacteria bacterium]